MDSTTLWIVIAAAALGGGGIAYLWNRARPAHDGRRVAELEAQLVAAREHGMRGSVQAAELEREASTLRTQLLEAVQRGAAFEERASQLEQKLRERGAEQQARLEEERQQSEEKLKLIVEAQRALENSFKSLSADALKSNNQSFLELAKASLAEFQQGAKGDLEKRQIAIDALVTPVKASLDKVDEKIAAIEEAREHDYREIRKQFTQMAVVQTQLRDETTNLVRALRQPHVRGRWGEIQLRRVVEMAGMMKHCDFVEQQSAEGEDGRLRPDLIVQLPGGRQIVVDSKAPITAYLEVHEATNDEVRKAKIVMHAQLMR